MGSLENRDRVLSRDRALAVICPKQPQAERSLTHSVHAYRGGTAARILLQHLEGRLKIGHGVRMGAAQDHVESSADIGDEVIGLVIHDIRAPAFPQSPREPMALREKHGVPKDEAT